MHDAAAGKLERHMAAHEGHWCWIHESEQRHPLIGMRCQNRRHPLRII